MELCFIHLIISFKHIWTLQLCVMCQCCSKAVDFSNSKICFTSPVEWSDPDGHSHVRLTHTGILHGLRSQLHEHQVLWIQWVNVRRYTKRKIVCVSTLWDVQQLNPTPLHPKFGQTKLLTNPNTYSVALWDAVFILNLQHYVNTCCLYYL